MLGMRAERARRSPMGVIGEDGPCAARLREGPLAELERNEVRTARRAAMQWRGEGRASPSPQG